MENEKEKNTDDRLKKVLLRFPDKLVRKIEKFRSAQLVKPTFTDTVFYLINKALDAENK